MESFLTTTDIVIFFGSLLAVMGIGLWVGRREDLLRRDPETRFKIIKRKIILAQNVMLPKVVNTFF